MEAIPRIPIDALASGSKCPSSGSSSRSTTTSCSTRPSSGSSTPCQRDVVCAGWSEQWRLQMRTKPRHRPQRTLGKSQSSPTCLRKSGERIISSNVGKDSPTKIGCCAAEEVSTKPPQAPGLETWRLESDGMSGAVHLSEFAEMRRLSAEDGPADAYKRSSNKRDLGHRCKYCRRPFSSLGEDLIAFPEQGPTQRFHPECWQKNNNNSQEEALHDHFAASGRRCRSSTQCWGNSAGTDYADVDVVTAYVDQWKRTATEPSKRTLRRGSRHSRSGVSTRTSPLDGLISVQDECGERYVARGFSKHAIDVAEVRWKCVASDTEECAVCLTCPEQALRLPCGHIFCSQCVVPWLRRCSLCPLCRKDLAFNSKRKSSRGSNEARPD